MNLNNVKNIFIDSERLAYSLFLLFISIIPFQFFTLQVQTRSVYICDLLFLATVFFWLISKRKTGICLPPKLILSALVLCSASLLLSTLTSIELKRSIVSLIGKFYVITVFIITVDMLNTKKRLRSALACLAASSSLVILCGLAGIALFYAGYSKNIFVWHDYGQLAAGNFPRLTASFETPQELGLFLSICIFYLLAFRAEFCEQQKKYAPVILCIMLASIPVFLFCLSRDIYGIVSGSFVFVLLSWYYRKEFCALGVLLSFFCAAAILAVFILSTIICITPIKVKLHANDAIPADQWTWNIGGGNTEAAHGFVDNAVISVNLHAHDKVYYFRDMVKTLKEKPLFGLGIGVAGSRNNMLMCPRDMHNSYWQVLVQQGYFGGLAMSFLIISIFVFCLRELKQTKNDKDKKALLLLICVLGAIIGTAYFNHHANNRMIWLAFGIATAAAMNLKGERTKMRLL